MLFIVSDERTIPIKKCSIVLPPLSSVSTLLEALGVEEEGEGDAVYLRPTFWDKGLGLHPHSTLPIMDVGLGIKLLDFSDDGPTRGSTVKDVLLLSGWSIALVVTLGHFFFFALT